MRLGDPGRIRLTQPLKLHKKGRQTMLQTINTIHQFSVVNHTLYFSVLALLTCIVCPGWYKLGRLQVAAAYASPAPMPRLRSSRFVFYRRGYAVVLSVANLLLLASIEFNNNTLAATIALKVVT
jgi:hypothetical protein